MKKIPPDDLICMNVRNPVFRVDLDYAKADNRLFGERIYRLDAKLWLHKDMAAIVVGAAMICHSKTSLRFVLHDGLRTIEAQEKMLNTRRVKNNPHWLEEPRLLSSPGSGGHPRGMAIDISLETEDGEALDMGTPFDYLAGNAAPETNPAHRHYKDLSTNARRNRAILDDAMTAAAEDLKIPMLKLPQEWWDFRLPPIVYEQYAPLADNDLPAEMRMTEI